MNFYSAHDLLKTFFVPPFDVKRCYGPSLSGVVVFLCSHAE